MAKPANKHILAIDLGTSGPKVALVSIDGEIAAHEFEKTDLLLFPNGGAEQNPDDWWRAIKSATRRLLNRHLVPIQDIVAVCCTSQWSGTVAVDAEGRPLMNAIIWMDARGAGYIRKLISGTLINVQGYGIGKLTKWLRLTGGAPGKAGKDPIAHILYLKNEHPDIYAATYKFLEPKDYLNLKLTGLFAASYDSITLHWCTDNRDIGRIAYDERLLRLATIEREKLPDLKAAVDILGPMQPAIAAELGIAQGIPVIMGTPDVQSATIGSGAVRDYEGHLYIGTSSWLTCHVPFKKVDLTHSMASLPAAIPNRYFVANEQETAGACVNFIQDNIFFNQDPLTTSAKPRDIYARLERIIQAAPPGSDNVIFTPWLFGERTPIEDSSVRGGFFNLSLQTQRAHMIRAVFEGVAYNARWLLFYVEKFIKRKMDAIHMVGGGANSNAWCQIHADVLGRTILQVKDPILTNVRGAGLLASLALGYLTLDDIAERIEISHTYEPDPKNLKIYGPLFKEFLRLYKQNRRIYARLNRVH